VIAAVNYVADRSGASTVEAAPSGDTPRIPQSHGVATSVEDN
jgi:hypothetical protein